MKCEFYCVYLIYLISSSFSSANIVCKDNETNTIYIAEDSDISMQLKKLSESFDIKIRDLKDDLNKQLANSILGLESKLEYLNKKFENISHQKRSEPVNQQLERTLEIGKKPTNCKEAMNSSHQHKSGIYEIKLTAVSPEPFTVLCDNDKHGGNWTVVMRRFDGSVDFNRDWNEYKNGFGSLTGEFFIGMDKLHAMTSSWSKQELLIELKTTENITKFAKYSKFTIGNENDRYELKELGNYSGNANDELKYYLGMKFSTRDVDNDLWLIGNCPFRFKGAWWYRKCGVNSLLGMEWFYWEPDFLKSAEILIRPAD